MESKVREELKKLMLEEYNFERVYQWAKDFMARPAFRSEMINFVFALKDLEVPLTPRIDLSKTIDLSSTGGDTIKTVNVGTISSFILAAAGLSVGKQATRAYTGLVGSSDLLTALGIEVPRENADPRIFEKQLETQGLSFYYPPAFSPNLKNQVRFMTELKERGLSFVTPWHLLCWVYNPLPLSYRIYGMFSDEYLEDVANIFLGLGLKRGLVVHGVGGMDEISSIGSTKVAEFSSEVIHLYELTPEDFGMRAANKNDIMITDVKTAIKDAVRILYNQETGPKRDIVLANSAAAFHIAGLAKNWKEGVELARSILASGKAKETLESFVRANGDITKLNQLTQSAGITS